MPPSIITDQPKGAKARRSGWRTIRKVGPYLWPQAHPWVKKRVMVSLVMLLVARLISVYTPFLYSKAVDVLAGEASPSGMLMLGAVGLTVAYGAARAMSVGFQQLRDVVFAKVGQRALRQLALETFQHIHALSLRYHITRKTGGLSRIIERGVKGVEFLLRFLLFSIGPLVVELLLIGIVLAVMFDIWYFVVVLVTLALYIWFTFAVTEWRVKIRKEMNDQDTDANQKAIDSLLNFETVKYFGAEAREAKRYDGAMEGYERALRAAGVPLDPLLVVEGNFMPSGGRTATLRLMAGPRRPDAIFCANDLMAIGCYEALKERGERIGETIAVMGYDDQEVAQHLSPGLSTVLLPHRAMGQLCAQALLSDDEPPVRQMRLECPLVTRQSHHRTTG